MKRPRRRNRARRARAAQRGAALIIVMLFLGLMLLLGLAATMTSITEVNVSANLRLQTEAFDTADAGATHAYELVRHMKGDFTALLRGPDNTLKSGDEFTNYSPARVFNTSGVATSVAGSMFDVSEVSTVENTNGRALVRIDARHFYELIPYDDAADDKSYMTDATLESSQDPTNHIGPGNPALDFDQRVLIRSIGYVMSSDVSTLSAFAPSNAVATCVVDVIVGLSPYPAVISNDDLDLTNSVAISGNFGSVHANDDLLLGSGNFTVSQSATFSNTDGVTPNGWNPTADDSHVSGYNGPQNQLFIPDLNPYAYAKDCDYLFVQQDTPAAMRNALVAAMNAADTVNRPGDALAAACVAAGHPLTDVTGGFSIKRTAVSPAAFTVTFSASNSISYSDAVTGSATGLEVSLSHAGGGSASISSIPAANYGKSVFVLLPTGAPDVTLNSNLNGQISVLTNGNIKLNGNAKVKPALTITPTSLPPWDRVQVLALAGEDVTMLGNAGSSDLIEGVLYAHEQFDLSGSGNLQGQVVAYERSLVYDSVSGTYVANTSVSSASSTPVPVHGSIVHGNFEIRHDVTSGYLGSFSVAMWRQLHDFDPATAAR